MNEKSTNAINEKYGIDKKCLRDWNVSKIFDTHPRVLKFF